MAKSKKVTRSKIKRMDKDDLSNFTNAELREFIRGARQLYDKQEDIFKKYEKSIYSPAFDKMQNFYDTKGKRGVSRMRKSDLTREAERLYDFFNSDTSTVAGVKRLYAEQDKTIFGEDEETGKPVKRLTFAQRTAFFSAYNEFRNMEKENYIKRMTSKKIFRQLGAMVLNKGRKASNLEFSVDDFVKLKEKIEGMRESDEWEVFDYENEGSDILSGKRVY